MIAYSVCYKYSSETNVKSVLMCESETLRPTKAVTDRLQTFIEHDEYNRRTEMVLQNRQHGDNRKIKHTPVLKR